MEDKTEEWHQVKLAKYEPLTKHLASHGFRSTVLAAEIGARGFVGYSAHQVCRQLGLSKRQSTKHLRDIAEASERASNWIWLTRATRDGNAAEGTLGAVHGV